MPDIFVPVDTSEYSTYYRDLVAKGVIYQYAIDYVDKHRKDIKKQYTTVDDFDKRFNVTEDMMQALIAVGEKEKVTFNEEQYNTSKRVLNTYLKALIARDTFAEQEAYTKIINHENPDLKAALNVIYDDELYNSLLLRGNPEYEAIAARHRAEQSQKQPAK